MKDAKMLLLNGPSLNLLGIREPEKYGSCSLSDIETELRHIAQQADIALATFQSNHEGALIDRIHQAFTDQIDFILFNPAGYTHTSVALRDALLAVQIPFSEIHITDVQSRESFRQHSYFSDIAHTVIQGHGIAGYRLALESAIRYCCD